METFKQVISIGRDKLISGIKYVYSDINPSTLTGAIDIIVIEQPDGTFKCGPFHVRFGKMGILKPADKIVDIHLNGDFLEHLHMKLGKAGEAYFVETINNNQQDSVDMSLAVSPIQSDSEDVKEEIDLSQRALSVENITSDLSNINFSRNNAKKRYRRSNRAKSEEFVVENEENETHSISDEEFIRGGYNSDGAIDQLTKEDLYDRNMTWDWGNFPLESHSLIEKAVNVKVIVENTDSVDQQISKSIEDSQDSVKGDAVCSKEKKSNDKKENEIYLEDVVKSDVPDEIKRKYIYSADGKTRNNAYNDNSTLSYDAGYKSDGESSVLAMTPTHPSVHELRLSLCGDASSNTMTDEKFFQYLVSFEDFMKEPDEILKNSNLVVLLNGKYYNWAVAAPILVSIIAFRTELPSNTVNLLKNTHMPEKKRRSAWFSWRRQDPIPVTVETQPSNIFISSLDTKSVNDEDDKSDKSDGIVDKNKVYLKKIRLSSEEIVALNLKPGRNDITFSMTTKYQGTTCAHAAIYLWKWFDKIVISDVDGTITKSDVLGHVLPILGRDWTQLNVVKLYNRIKQNNYKFIYLSARAIGQSSRTRTFLQDVIQDSSEKLPDGPILLSPTSLFQSLHREVIEKKPEYFKIQCLNDVRSLFPEDLIPLYAGFGNRVNDVIAYKAVGIDQRRIFTVNHEGSLKNEYCQKWSTSYGNLSDLVDFFFHFNSPPNKSTFSDTLADFTDVNYWNVPVDEQEIRNEINKLSSD